MAKRGGGHPSAVSPEQDAEIVRRTAAGEGPTEIGQALGLTKSIVNGRVRTLNNTRDLRRKRSEYLASLTAPRVPA